MVWLKSIARLGVARCSRTSVVLGQTTLSPLLRPSVQPVQWCVLGSFQPAVFYSTPAPSTDLSVVYKYGRPMLLLPLPSRQEACRFWLRPMLTSVGDFLSDISREDPGVSSAAVLTIDGERVSSSTSLDTVLNKDFVLQLNDQKFTVRSLGRESHEHVSCLDDMKCVVQMLHTALHLPGHHQLTHTQLLERLDALTRELGPMEKERAHMLSKADRHAMNVAWAGLAYMSLQGGFLAYLTWYVFAWDVMEPITYFLTYTSSMGFFAYYILTKQDLLYPDAKDRQALHYFHKRAAMEGFNLQRYNQLRDELHEVESDLKRLRNPIQLQLPVDQVSPRS